MGEGVSGSGEGGPASSGRGGRRGRKATAMGPGRVAGSGGEGGEMARTRGYVPAPGYDAKGDMIAGAQVILRVYKMGKKMRDPNAPKKNISAYLMYQSIMR